MGSPGQAQGWTSETACSTAQNFPEHMPTVLKQGRGAVAGSRSTHACACSCMCLSGSLQETTGGNARMSEAERPPYMLSAFLQFCSVTCLKHLLAINRELQAPSDKGGGPQPCDSMCSVCMSAPRGMVLLLAMGGPSLLGQQTSPGLPTTACTSVR